MGARIRVYEIVSLLGAGGMGEVYRARDSKLGRDVAIKVLPSAFTSDHDRLARFEREARLLATLNHPHIGAIYGLEDADGVRALVLELIEGETLRERLIRGVLPLAEALAIARQIAEALEAAHEKGIVHRDLKPANIILQGARGPTPTRWKTAASSVDSPPRVSDEINVKVLDFGLAKAASADGSVPDLSNSPTVTIGGTRDGIILGTAAYMSPEQARGKPIDKRTDIWAFGCVLYEMLTGRQAFSGETVAEVLAKILERETDIQYLPSTTPLKVRDLIRRCLQKDPRHRLHDIADARIELEDALTPATTETPSRIDGEHPGRVHRTAWLAIGIVAGAIAAGALIAILGVIVTSYAIRRLQIKLFVPDTGERRLLIPAGASARYVPTGHLVYAQEGGLYAVPFDLARLELTGSPVPILSGVRTELHGAGQFTFGGDGTLAYVEGPSAAKGTLVWGDRKGGIERLPVQAQQYGHLALSPDRSRIAVEITSAKTDVFIFDLTRASWSQLTTEGNNVDPVWTPDGKRVVFGSDRGGPVNLFWQLADGGAPAEGLLTSKNDQFPHSWSPDGKLLAFNEFDSATRYDIGLVRTEGSREARPIVRTRFSEAHPVFSPDGRWIAFSSDESGRFEIYVQRYPATSERWKISTDGGVKPIWSPTGDELFYEAGLTRMVARIVRQPVFAAGRPQVFTEGPYINVPGRSFDVDRDGRRLLLIREADQPSAFFYRALTTDGGSPQAPVYLSSLGSTDRTLLLNTDAANVVYSGGHLLFLRQNTLMAQPFDERRLTPTGEGVPIAENVRTSTTFSPLSGQFTASESGVLAYQGGSAEYSRLTWHDRSGRQLSALGDPAVYGDVRISPRGDQAAVNVADPVSLARDIWIFDLTRGFRTKFTFDPDGEGSPIWSPDGSRIVFNSNRKGTMDLYHKAASRSDVEDTLLLEGPLNQIAEDWSRDGQFILYGTNMPTGRDLWVLPLFGDRKPFPFRRTSFNELAARFSPDGRWIAYQSNESGRFEVRRSQDQAACSKYRQMVAAFHDGVVMEQRFSILIEPID